jgi:hypothetical protein
VASLIAVTLIVAVLTATGRSLARQAEEARGNASSFDLGNDILPGLTGWQRTRQSARDSWRWSIWHLGSSRAFEMSPVPVYVLSAIGSWGIGHLAGVPDGTWASMLTGYGGGAVVAVVLLALGARAIGRVQGGSLVEELGYARLIAASRIKPSSTDRSGRLWRIPLPHRQELTVVEVLNSTAEADGTYKRYFLRVPSEVRTAHEAVAWTFGVQRADYSPLVET